MEKMVLQSPDGYPLAVSVFEPKGNRCGAVLIVPAMGVSKSFYAAFAEWLATEGFLVMCFDFRGIGESLKGNLSAVSGDIITWAEDVGIVLAKLKTVSEDLPINWIGHSLGGQIIPMVPGHEQLEKVFTVAAGSGYWLENSWSLRWRVGLVWFVLVPLLLPIFGYFPGKRLKMIGDLPRGVMRQWRNWCINPQYCVGVEGPEMRKKFSEVSVPIVSISFTDDEMMSASNTNSLHSWYSGAAREMIRVSPKDFGLSRIGHFGFFRHAVKNTLWKQLILPQLVTNK